MPCIDDGPCLRASLRIERWSCLPGKIAVTGPAPSAADLEEHLRAGGMEPRWWPNGPGEIYAPHEHAHHKVLYCHQGSITFRLPLSGEVIELRPGDSLDLPPGARHPSGEGPRWPKRRPLRGGLEGGLNRAAPPYRGV